MASASRARGLASATGAAASDGADSTGSADPVNLNRDALPRLPVPDLKASCQLFLGSIRPLVKDEGEMQGIADELERFSAEGGLGERLQKRLEDFESKQPNSWLEDIWLRKAYLESRDPLPVNSNWWCQLKDHPAQPANLLELPPPRGVFTAFQIRRAAILTQNLLRFYSLMTQGHLEPQQLHGAPLCMNQFKHIFGATRIPGTNVDSLFAQYPNPARHIIVMACNQAYKVPVIPEDDQPLSIREIESQLLAVTRDALEDKSEPEIAILTSESRDTWATLRERLLDISPVNAESLSQIQNALFVLNLDDYSLPDAADKAYEQFFWGSRLQNRWFDKVVQIIVANNGRAGLNGEHSPCDAVITCTALDYAVASEVRHKDVEDRDVAMPPPVKLQWKVDDVISNGIDAARGRAQKLAKLLISDVLVFPIYGGRYIRDTARISPDTYVQLALQLAWARVNEEPTSIYETATQRLFLNGRTETCRSLSVESEAFARAFDNDDVLYEDKLELFRNAASSHRNYMKQAIQGKAFDRHFLGLQSMIETQDELSDSIFSKPWFQRSSHFGLSTSNVSPGTNYHGGFAPAIPQGYGINYAIDEGQLRFTISCRRGDSDSGKAKLAKFKAALERSLRDMRLMFPKAPKV